MQNQIIERGILPPGVAKPREGYKEIKIGFWGGQPELLDSRITGYEMNDIERDIVDVISKGIKTRSENRKTDSLVDGYLIKGYQPAKDIEKETSEKHINFSKLLDFAIVGCLIAEMLAAVILI